VGTFRVSVSKQYLGFSAAHFLTFRGHACESLHGHNYRIAVTVEGPLDPECHFVVDFAVLKQTVRALADQLDHRVILPSTSDKLTFRRINGMTLVDYLGGLRYQFPDRDCATLPIANSTAERLAEWFAHQVAATLKAAGVTLDALELEVEESPGQSATYLLRCDSPSPELS
jgi:6-pyruvoyltetrahydropterin/6-carboxytetrahydropterin synthase